MHELDEINGHLMDGLDFCRKVCSLFDTIRCSPNGVERLRLRREKTVNKLFKEIIPIARYVQMKYSPGRSIKVKWIDGSQQYDAALLFSGYEVERKILPRKQYLEATMAVHQNDYLSRRHLHEKGVVYGIKGVRRDKKTKKIISDPVSYDAGRCEAATDFAKIVQDRIEKKAKTKYPKNISLVVQCVLDTLYFDHEWDYMIKEVQKAHIKHNFREILLFDNNYRYFATLY